MLPNKKLVPADVVLRIGIKTRFPLIVVPAALGLLVALIVSSRLPNVYQAETLIQIVPQRVTRCIRALDREQIKTEDRLEALGQQVQSRTQLERMISRAESVSQGTRRSADAGHRRADACRHVYPDHKVSTRSGKARGLVLSEIQV